MDITAEVKELVQDWVLLTYDIPANKAKLRRDFLRAAHSIGAEEHTASVYLIPYSDEAMVWANELESAGHAVVWTAYQQDETKAIEITTKYSAAIKARCDYIEQRIAIAQKHMNEGKLGVAARMGIKTGKLLQQLVNIAKSFNPTWFQARIEELYNKYKSIYDS